MSDRPYTAMKMVVLVFALTTALLWCSPVWAGWRIDLATQVADRAWGQAPCHVQLEFAPLPHRVYAWTVMPTCRIVFNSDRRWQHEPFVLFCSVMVHERGHIAGRDHSDDPTDIMYPFLVGYDRRCLWGAR